MHTIIFNCNIGTICAVFNLVFDEKIVCRDMTEQITKMFSKFLNAGELAQFAENDLKELIEHKNCNWQYQSASGDFLGASVQLTKVPENGISFIVVPAGK